MKNQTRNERGRFVKQTPTLTNEFKSASTDQRKSLTEGLYYNPEEEPIRKTNWVMYAVAVVFTIVVLLILHYSGVIKVADNNQVIASGGI